MLGINYSIIMVSVYQCYSDPWPWRNRSERNTSSSAPIRGYWSTKHKNGPASRSRQQDSCGWQWRQSQPRLQFTRSGSKTHQTQNDELETRELSDTCLCSPAGKKARASLYLATASLYCCAVKHVLPACLLSCQLIATATKQAR